MTARIGHNKPPAHVYVDMARLYRWAICKSKLSPIASLIAHTIGVLFDEDGSPVWPSIKWISENSRIPIGTVKKYMSEVRAWRDLVVEKARGRRGNTYKVNIDIDEARAEYEAWEEFRHRIAGQPRYPATRLAGHSGYPPTRDHSLAGHPSSPSTASRISDQQKSPVAGHQNPVAGHPRISATKTKNRKTDRPAPIVSTVVPLSDDTEWIRRKLEPFGEHGRRWAEEYAKFFGIPVTEAVEQMEMAALSHGTFNVVEAIREAVAMPNVKSPKGLFKHLLTEQSKHGKRAMPKQVVGSQVRILSMAERSFR